MTAPAPCHCGQDATRKEIPDPWDGRLDGYCDDCAWARCDSTPDQCPNKPAPSTDPAYERLPADAITGAPTLVTYDERTERVVLVERKLKDIARLKPGWDGAITRSEARTLLNELGRLRGDTRGGARTPTPATGSDAQGERHPESYCHRCGGENYQWVAPSPLWNAVMRGGDINGDDVYDGIVCPTCFAGLAEDAGIARDWRLAALDVKADLQVVTPSGRRWNPENWLWDEPGCGGAR